MSFFMPFESKGQINDLLYLLFYIFFAHESQYFSIIVAPSTANIASCVAVLPQLTQYFVFPPTSTNALIDEKFFSILYLHFIVNMQLHL